MGGGIRTERKTLMAQGRHASLVSVLPDGPAARLQRKLLERCPNRDIRSGADPKVGGESLSGTLRSVALSLSGAQYKW